MQVNCQSPYKLIIFFNVFRTTLVVLLIEIQLICRGKLWPSAYVKVKPEASKKKKRKEKVS